MMLNNTDIMRLSEAAAKAGTSAQQAAEAIIKAFGHIVEMVAAYVSVADVIEKHKQPPDNALKEVATPKEWHLMNHAKKARTRKKYRNRLIKRYYKAQHTERRTKA